jgi:F0F1-type ATP synthase membrane subunit c/vacuolar-type H+-ATPase subunit K
MKIEKNDLIPHWLVVGMMLLALIIYLIICHQFGHELQEPLPESRRLVIRTIFYALAIAAFPVTNLIRHIQNRLNQTMSSNKSAKSRYLLTIIVSMALVEAIGVLGFVMFMIGDDFNTLYIFTGLSALGLYLYRPKEEEYAQIIEALANQYRSTIS